MSTPNIYGGKKPSNLSILLIIFIAFAAGYTVADFPSYFLDFFKTPIGQFLVYFPVIYVTYKDEKDFYWTDMVFKSLLMVLIVRLIKKALDRFDPNKHHELETQPIIKLKQ